MIIVLTFLQSHWLPWTIFYGVFLLNLVLDAWLLKILWQQRVRKSLAWFVAYIGWELLSTVVGLATYLVSSRLYIAVYWWKEGIRMALLVGTVRESLLRIFRGFNSLLRWSVAGVIMIVLLYSAWKAVHVPPVQSNRIASFMLGAEFTFRWGIAGVTVVALALMWSMNEPKGSRESAVITGVAIAAMGFVAWAIIRSVFGTRFLSFAQYLPDMGYFIAAFYWIKMFSRPASEVGLDHLGMEPKDALRELGRYREIVEWVRSKL